MLAGRLPCGARPPACLTPRQTQHWTGRLGRCVCVMRRSLRAYTAQKLSQHATRVMDGQGVPPAVGRDQQDVFLDLMSQVGCWQKVPSTQTASRSHPVLPPRRSYFGPCVHLLPSQGSASVGCTEPWRPFQKCFAGHLLRCTMQVKCKCATPQRRCEDGTCAL